MLVNMNTSFCKSETGIMLNYSSIALGQKFIHHIQCNREMNFEVD